MKNFKFIDLFAGIGGFHYALHDLGGECVFASEVDPFARKTYEHNLRKISPELFQNKMFNDDIRNFSVNEIPDFDILCAGFPCQPFSQAGQKRGFDDNQKSERGNLFFNIVDILEAKRPKAFFLENVRGIINHDNGNTFRVIRNYLEDELGYSFYFKVVHASEYGLPQLRPRAFMIGFRDEGFLKSFQFPPPLPLKFNMSDVWGGQCSREIGFTIRVGGRGSPIDDRRNWDSYLVDGEVRKLMPPQAKMMQGFPNDFEFPVSAKESMKQLGNSVAIDAVREYAKALIQHMNEIDSRITQMSTTKNKGEWTELYSFLRIIKEKQILLSDKDLNINNELDHFKVSKVTTLNIEESCHLNSDDTIEVINKATGSKNTIQVSELINQDTLQILAKEIKNGSRTFNIPQFDLIQSKLGISIIKGGNSNQKADIVLDIHNKNLKKSNEGFGIKSYLGSKPTLLNASGNTNFLYEVVGLNSSHLISVNSINTATKLRDRINKIHELGGILKFHKIETNTMEYNLSLIDTAMPELLSLMLLEFFVNRNSNLKTNLSNLYEKSKLSSFSGDLTSFKVKVQRLLVAVLLGFFAGTKWDGKYASNGTIVVKENGEQVGFHITELSALEDYLFENIKFDTPSTTRHRYGSLIAETDGKVYFKLNLQLRF